MHAKNSNAFISFYASPKVFAKNTTLSTYSKSKIGKSTAHTHTTYNLVIYSGNFKHIFTWHLEFFHSPPKMLTWYIIESFLEEREKQIEYTRITNENYISKMGDHFTIISNYITLLIIKA